MDKILEIENLRVSYYTYAGEVQSVRGVSFDVEKGEAVAIVGESGCGKSVTAKSIMRLIKTPPGEIKDGSQILYKGKDVLKMDKKELSEYRGGEVAIIFQDALASLNPTMTVGKQIVENLMMHRKRSSAQNEYRCHLDHSRSWCSSQHCKTDCSDVLRKNCGKRKPGRYFLSPKTSLYKSIIKSGSSSGPF